MYYKNFSIVQDVLVPRLVLANLDIIAEAMDGVYRTINADVQLDVRFNKFGIGLQ